MFGLYPFLVYAAVLLIGPQAGIEPCMLAACPRREACLHLI